MTGTIDRRYNRIIANWKWEETSGIICTSLEQSCKRVGLTRGSGLIVSDRVGSKKVTFSPVGLGSEWLFLHDAVSLWHLTFVNVAASVVLSKLDYCNSVYYNLPKSKPNKNPFICNVLQCTPSHHRIENYRFVSASLLVSCDEEMAIGNRTVTLWTVTHDPLFVRHDPQL